MLVTMSSITINNNCKVQKTLIYGSTIPLKGTNLVENFVIYYMFLCNLHRTTIVQNEIISSIRSCLFFCLTYIYRHRLEKVNPNPSQSLNIYLKKKKKTLYSELYGLQCIVVQFSFILKKILMYYKTCQNV